MRIIVAGCGSARARSLAVALCEKGIDIVIDPKKASRIERAVESIRSIINTTFEAFDDLINMNLFTHFNIRRMVSLSSQQNNDAYKRSLHNSNCSRKYRIEIPP